ncbi:MAG: hypothetical protein ACYC0H_19010, partial [Solirubrobacteraceae bacterium]
MHPREGWSEGGIRRRPEPDEGGLMSRRQLLGAGAGVALGALLAGCGGSSGSGGSATGGSGGGSGASASSTARASAGPLLPRPT